MSCGIYQIVCFRDYEVTKESLMKILTTKKVGKRRFKLLDQNKVYYYIGSSCNIERRWKEHLTALKNNKHYNIIMQHCYNKYGEKSFAFVKLEECSLATQFLLEQFYINTFKPKLNIVNIVNSIPEKETIPIKKEIQIHKYLTADMNHFNIVT